jgi:hypothetical protein
MSSGTQLAGMMGAVELEDIPLRYPVVHGFRLGEEIGGGGFSKCVSSNGMT